jgi:putative SOS response-associated peptidase YedK
MCGRYSFAPKPQAILDLFGDLELPPVLEQSFNIAPTHASYLITNETPNQLSSFQWGLVPRFVKSGKPDGRHINARAETLLTNPIFQAPFHSHRCLVLADSFYEWKQVSAKVKQPYRIHRRDGKLLVFAGIWDQYFQADRLVSQSFAIITTGPNTEMTNLHQRMPAILNDADECSTWLSRSTNVAQAHKLLRPAPDATLAMYPVSNLIGKHTVNHAGLHRPVAAQKSLFD